jgi:hypothetical protein
MRTLQRLILILKANEQRAIRDAIRKEMAKPTYHRCGA